MMKIESVAAQPDRAGRHRVCFADGSIMRLYKQTVQDFGLYPGKELTPETYGTLQKAAGEMSAKMRAVRIVSASSVSKKDLERRLIQKGEDPEQAKHAVAWMSDMQFIDDRKTAEQIVRKCAAKGYGIARAKQALYEKRIPKEYWEETLEDYPDQTDAIVAFLKARLPEDGDRRAIQKVTNSLILRGHSYTDIRRGLEQIYRGDDFWED